MTGGRAVEYDDEIDSVSGVRALLDILRAEAGHALIDWRYAHTVKLELDQVSAELETATLRADQMRSERDAYKNDRDRFERGLRECTTELREAETQRDRAIRWAVRLEGELAEAEAEASRWRRIAETAATAETERLAAEHASRGCDICTDKIGTEVTPAGAS